MHLVLAVSDVDRAKQFYDEAFGWQPHLEWPGEYAELELPDNDWLGLYREDGYAESAGAPVEELKRGRYGGAELYVQVDDVEAAMDSLRKAGREGAEPARTPRLGPRGGVLRRPGRQHRRGRAPGRLEA